MYIVASNWKAASRSWPKNKKEIIHYKIIFWIFKTKSMKKKTTLMHHEIFIIWSSLVTMTASIMLDIKLNFSACEDWVFHKHIKKIKLYLLWLWRLFWNLLLYEVHERGLGLLPLFVVCTKRNITSLKPEFQSVFSHITINNSSSIVEFKKVHCT